MDDTLANQIGIHVPRMYRVAYRVLGSADAAHDVVQEACVKALMRVDGFEGRSTLSTWLHRITLNCAKDALRSETRREQRREAIQDSFTSVAVGPSAAELAETRELVDLARAMLEKLPEDCRSAFALTQLDGYSYDEAADIESEPRGTIASRVHRAKKILLAQMSTLVDGKAKS
jgi:RNA polymerase sigma-70 factor (ECF subfamily)